MLFYCDARNFFVRFFGFFFYVEKETWTEINLNFNAMHGYDWNHSTYHNSDLISYRFQMNTCHWHSIGWSMIWWTQCFCVFWLFYWYDNFQLINSVFIAENYLRIIAENIIKVFVAYLKRRLMNFNEKFVILLLLLLIIYYFWYSLIHTRWKNLIEF